MTLNTRWKNWQRTTMTDRIKFEAVFEIELSRSKVNAHIEDRDIHVYPGDLYFESADVKSVKLQYLDTDGNVTETIEVK